MFLKGNKNLQQLQKNQVFFENNPKYYDLKESTVKFSDLISLRHEGHS